MSVSWAAGIILGVGNTVPIQGATSCSVTESLANRRQEVWPCPFAAIKSLPFLHEGDVPRSCPAEPGLHYWRNHPAGDARSKGQWRQRPLTEFDSESPLMEKIAGSMENQPGCFLCWKLAAPLGLETEARVSRGAPEPSCSRCGGLPWASPPKCLQLLNQESATSVSRVPGTPPCLARHHLLHHQLFLGFSSSRLPSAPTPRVRDSLWSQSTQPCRDLWAVGPRHRWATCLSFPPSVCLGLSVCLSPFLSQGLWAAISVSPEWAPCACMTLLKIRKSGKGGWAPDHHPNHTTTPNCWGVCLWECVCVGVHLRVGQRARKRSRRAREGRQCRFCNLAILIPFTPG